MTNKYELMPVNLCKKLIGLTVNEALQQGIITHVGDSHGNFVFSDAEHIETFYALINNFIVKCSENVVNSGVDIASIAGGLVFYPSILNGHESVKLGMPNSIKLGNVVAQLKKGE